MKVYISGAITGRPKKEVEEQFTTAYNRLRLMGYTPVSPLHNGLPDTAPWEKHMVRDIELLLECQGVYFLHGWELSRGARIEYKVAKEAGIYKIINTEAPCMIAM